MKKIILTRIYDKDFPSGFRILCDRIWPRGISKERANLDYWAKDIAPSNDLRKWFNHDPEKFAEFSSLYLDELSKNPKSNEFVNFVREILKKEDVLLLIGARDSQHNHELVLEDFLNKRLAQSD